MYEVNLTWESANSAALGFRIYRSTSPLDVGNLPPHVTTLPPSHNTYLDTSPPQDTTVYYIVSTFDEDEEVCGDEISVLVGGAAPITDDIMVLNVKGPIALAAYMADTEVGIEYSQDGVNWDTYVNYTSPVSEGELYLRVPTGTTIDRLDIARWDSAMNFLGVEKWWDVGCNLQLGYGTAHNFTVPDHAPPNVTDMSWMFSYANAFNQDISSWDVSKVTDMSYMFWDCWVFDQDISNWDVSKVTNMSRMFMGCTSFNQDISSWDVPNVERMDLMFSGCRVFNQDIGGWDVSNVTDMSSMFGNCRAFNQDISSWDVSNVTNMSYMFQACWVFNQDISSWDVSNVVDMGSMFSNCRAFSQDLSSWNVSNVTNMSSMFAYCNNFNQPISNWDLSNVTNMDYMFSNCPVFNQDLSGWCVTNIPTEPSGFNIAGALSLAYYPVWGTCPTAIPDGGDEEGEEPYPTVVGEFFGGGYYIGNITTSSGGDAGTYAVIMGGPESEATLPWKDPRSRTAGTESTTDGRANTLAMQASDPVIHYAGMHCLNYRGGGHDDWYLGAKDELNLAWLNRTELGWLNRTGLAMEFNQYWSSTQDLFGSYAWSQRFTDGAQVSGSMATNYKVRPVRCVKLP